MTTDGQACIQTKEFESFRVKSVDAEKRQIRVLASSGDLDRCDERIEPEAFRNHLSVYMSNPVVLSAHQQRSSSGEPTVVGRAVKIWIDKRGLWAIIEFAETELAEEYWQLYRDGFMRAVSVGFIPIEWRDELENGTRVRVFTEVELLEISCVPVPANRGALVKSRQRKSDFVANKKAERFNAEKFLDEITAKVEQENEIFGEEHEKFLDERRQEDPDFDKKKYDEFAKMILSYDGEGEMFELDTPGHDFTELVSGEPMHKGFAALVYGEFGR